MGTALNAKIVAGVALAAIIAGLLLVGYALLPSSRQASTVQIATSNPDFRIVHTFSEPADGIVVTALANPSGADARFYVTIQNTRSATLTRIVARVVNGSFSFCSPVSCSGSVTADLCPGGDATCSIGDGEQAILTSAGRGAVAGESYVVEVTATYLDGRTSTLYLLIEATSQS